MPKKCWTKPKKEGGTFTACVDSGGKQLTKDKKPEKKKKKIKFIVSDKPKQYYKTNPLTGKLELVPPPLRINPIIKKQLGISLNDVKSMPVMNYDPSVPSREELEGENDAFDWSDGEGGAGSDSSGVDPEATDSDDDRPRYDPEADSSSEDEAPAPIAPPPIVWNDSSRRYRQDI